MSLPSDTMLWSDDDEREIRNAFRYHAPTEEKVQMHERVRERMTDVAVEIAAMLPPSREKSLFLERLQEAQMWANASIAIHVRGEE